MRDEEQRERYRELLEETRTVMPGTQVLFAFLLTAAFSESFKDLDLLAKRSYAAALLLAAVAAITLMAPTAFHRISDPGTRAERLKVSTKLQVTGMFLLLASMTLVTFVVGRLIFDDTLVGVLFGGDHRRHRDRPLVPAPPGRLVGPGRLTAQSVKTRRARTPTRAMRAMTTRAMLTPRPTLNRPNPIRSAWR